MNNTRDLNSAEKNEKFAVKCRPRQEQQRIKDRTLGCRMPDAGCRMPDAKNCKRPRDSSQLPLVVLFLQHYDSELFRADTLYFSYQACGTI
jgi:hypothetical protein